MKFDKQKMLCGFVFMITCPTASYATGMFGNPTVVGTTGKVEILVGGGKSSQFDLDSKKTTAVLQIGNMSGSYALPASSDTLKEDQVFIGMSYTLDARSQLFASLGTGKDSGQHSSSRTIGVKISPEAEATEIRMGLMLRAQQVNTDIEGPFSLSTPYNQLNDGTNTSYFFGPINGTEQIKYTRMDTFFGASRNTGVIRPYGGLCLTYISGTDTVALDDMVTVWSYPNAGGPNTSSTQHVSFNAKSDIAGRNYFSTVLGLSINPSNSNIGMTAEFQSGVQKAFMLSGNIKF